jgi:N-acyl-L-homoserine lactone synthetase
MIHVVTAANRRFYEPQLLQMHRQRKKIFIDRRGWKALTVAENGGEYDQGDDDRAIYFLALTSFGDVERAMRLRPTDDWSMLGDLFPQFVGPDEAPVNNSDVWEMARYYTIGNTRQDENFGRRGEFGLSLLEKAVQCGISRVLLLSDLALVGSVMRSGWKMRIIGLPGAYAEGECVAGEIECSIEAVETLKERLNIRGTALLEFDENHPLAELGPLDAELFLDAVQHLTPESRQLMAGITRSIAKIEAAEGVDAAIAAVERVRTVIGPSRAVGQRLAGK